MSFRTVLMVAMALVFGTSAAIGVNQLRKGSAGPSEDTVAVVVSAADVPRFTTLSADMVKLRAFPKSFVPTGALTRVEDAVDRVAITPMVKDEPVLDGRLSQKGTGRGMAAVIPKGMRAVTIQTPNVATGVAGFILPGNRVDVLFTMRSNNQNDNTGGGSTTTLLQSVEIMAVDQRVDAPADYKVDVKELRSVTLLVSPDQAAKLDLAQNLGTLQLALRNPQDKGAAEDGVATLSGIRFQQGKPWEERFRTLMDAGSKLVAAMPARPKTVQVWVAKADIPAGTKIGDPASLFEKAPMLSMPENAVTDVSALKGQTLIQPVYKNQFVPLTALVGTAQKKPGPPKKPAAPAPPPLGTMVIISGTKARAYSFNQNTNEVIGVSGSARPSVEKPKPTPNEAGPNGEAGPPDGSGK